VIEVWGVGYRLAVVEELREGQRTGVVELRARDGLAALELGKTKTGVSLTVQGCGSRRTAAPAKLVPDEAGGGLPLAGSCSGSNASTSS